MVLYQNLTLKEAHKILTKINAAVSERFVIKETTVIHSKVRPVCSYRPPPHTNKGRAVYLVLVCFWISE